MFLMLLLFYMDITMFLSQIVWRERCLSCLCHSGQIIRWSPYRDWEMKKWRKICHVLKCPSSVCLKCKIFFSYFIKSWHFKHPFHWTATIREMQTHLETSSLCCSDICCCLLKCCHFHNGKYGNMDNEISQYYTIKQRNRTKNFNVAF